MNSKDQQSSRAQPQQQPQHYDVTECVICADTYTDPRQLPCLHTFCLACIEAYSRDRQPADTVACPLCRRESWRRSELVALPKDRFVSKMLMVRRLTSQVASHLQCDACDSHDGDAVACNYCVDCCQSLCKPCAVVHRSSSAGHEMVKLRKRRPSRPDKLLSKLSAPCPSHADECRDMLCVDCMVTACRKCLADGHRSHRAGRIDRLGAQLRDDLAADVGRMQQSVARCRGEIDRLRRTRDDFAVRFIHLLTRTHSSPTVLAGNVLQSVMSVCPSASVLVRTN